MWRIQESHEVYNKTLNLVVGVTITHGSKEAREVYQSIFDVITESLSRSVACDRVYESYRLAVYPWS